MILEMNVLFFLLFFTQTVQKNFYIFHFSKSIYKLYNQDIIEMISSFEKTISNFEVF